MRKDRLLLTVLGREGSSAQLTGEQEQEKRQDSSYCGLLSMGSIWAELS